MKKIFGILLLGGFLWFSPVFVKAETFYMSYYIVKQGQNSTKGSRIPKRPLSIELTNHTLTLPSQVHGFTLTLTSGSSEVFVYYITENVISLPLDLQGDFEVKITDGKSSYQGNVTID